ncbi:hypothetical protein MHU86_21758 [Fragilaria crotonensis]|nr:hypothetical protein MHU86_21758 [Fragilaria crotonensis]
MSTTNPSLPPSAVLAQASQEDIIWEKVDRTAIEAQILKYNSTAFRTATESPCGHGIIHNELTFTSLSSSAQHLLLSGYVPPEWHKGDTQLEAFFSSFAVPDHVRAHDEISSEISSSDIEWGMKKWRESTATSPSGRHLGHYKALITNPVLLDGLTKFLNIAISNGISAVASCTLLSGLGRLPWLCL